MNKLFYPAIFHKAEEGGFWVSFPDLPECFTEGESISHAYEMAVDALGLALSSVHNQGNSFPRASEPDQLQIKENEYIVIVEFDIELYRKRKSSRAVKKTLSIPEWLNEEAMSKGINFSQVLQEALIAKIQ